MKTLMTNRHGLLAIAVAAALMAACAPVPVKPDGATDLRNRLNQLEANPDLAMRAPLAFKEADTAVTAAEKPELDKALGAHLVFMADRKVGIAEAIAEAHLAVDQRKTIEEQREAMRLAARTNEADSANHRAAVAQADTADAQRKAQDLQKQIDDLHAKVTDRGIVLTLGDVLFATGTATLNAGVSANLGKLVAFLDKYPDRNALIEGYTDSIGSDDYNQGLSERRADSVKIYLVEQGIASSRLTASGKGKSSPIGDNGSATGRQQNRRVEVIIQNTMVSSN